MASFTKPEVHADPPLTKKPTPTQQKHATQRKRPQPKTEQVATVMVATARITTAAQIDPSYSPGGVNVHIPPWAHASLPTNRISIGVSCFAGLTVINNRETDHVMSRYVCSHGQHIALRVAMLAKTKK